MFEPVARPFWLTTTSHSMMPLMPPNSRIFIQPIAPALLRVGDIAVFIADNKLIAHRVLIIKTDVFLQSGDAMLSAHTISFSQLLGKVLQIETTDKIFVLSRKNWLQKIIARSSHFIIRLHPQYPRLSHYLHRFKFHCIRLIIKIA
ncbi:S26 family signal peptidase [Beggiatoa leptomitoformis]|uniref:Uncharacterized protein n=1 Tax=Beggiatoa leptomitoformis TaxID=288004 RepID=A0A2N9YG69_9GAMM|nr:S26 family signal peptidase [Beggiatoa leptomitoformis]ALG68307.1 hypothetical protein AL038_12035 [Beggiatoa leptomitoformis]AUI69379.1 hypothetical protein BLE401_12230 [Beggiatoa leptomitoformis]